MFELGKSAFVQKKAGRRLAPAALLGLVFAGISFICPRFPALEAQSAVVAGQGSRARKLISRPNLGLDSTSAPGGLLARFVHWKQTSGI